MSLDVCKSMSLSRDGNRGAWSRRGGGVYLCVCGVWWLCVYVGEGGLRRRGSNFWHITMLQKKIFHICCMKLIETITQESWSCVRRLFNFCLPLHFQLSRNLSHHCLSTYKLYGIFSLLIVGKYWFKHCPYYLPYRDVFPDTSHGWINDERMAVHCLESGWIGLHNAHPLWPQENSWLSGMDNPFSHH